MRTATLPLLAGLFLAAPAAAAPPASLDVLPFQAVERTLANGLKVIVVPTGLPGLVAVQIPVLVGSRNEVEPGKSGFAHLFEHMMFRGTRRYPRERYQALMKGMGARQNGFTQDDLTSYHVTVAQEDLEAVLDLEADRFQHLDYSEAAFRTEAGAVLGEYHKSVADPILKLIEVQRAEMFGTHPYRHTTMGLLRDIEAMPDQYAFSRQFFDRWYRPEHAAVIVAGDVDPARTLALVEKHFGAWRRGTHRAEVPQEPPASGPRHAHVAWAAPTPPFVSVAFRAPGRGEPGLQAAALDLLYEAHFGPTSDLYRRLVEEEQKVDLLFGGTSDALDPERLAVYARVKDPKDAVLVRDALLAECARARAVPLDARRLADLRSSKRYALVRSLDTSEQIALQVALASKYRRDAGALNRLYRQYDQLTPADLQAAARCTFTDAGLALTTLSSDPLDPAIGKAPPLATFEAALAASAAAAPVPVVALPSRLPQLTVKLLFEAGSARDPAGLEGLAAVSAAMLTDAGSRLRRADEIRALLQPHAATFTAGVDKEMVVLSGSFHRDHWEEFLAVALPQLTDPGLREEDLRRVKGQLGVLLAQELRESNDEELGRERLQASAHAGTPYGHPAVGTLAGLERVTLDDVKAFVRRHYVRANLVIGLGGDAPKGLQPALQAALGALPEGVKAAPTAVAPRRPKGLEVEIVEKETGVTAISLGHPLLVRRGHPDFAALWLARSWLGEHRSFNSHLFQRLREARGLNYGDYAYLEAFPWAMNQLVPEPNLGRRSQLFEVWIRAVAPEHAHLALRLALHEVRRLVAEGLSEEDFQATRQYLMKSVFQLTASQDQQVGAALDSRWYGTPELTTYLRDGLAKLTRAEVNRAIRAHLSGEDLSVVIVTRDARGLAAALARDEASSIRYQAEKPAALLAEDAVVGAMKLGLAPQAIRITPVAEVFAR